MQRGLIREVIKEFSNSSNEIAGIKYFDGYYYNLHQMYSGMFVLRLKRNYILSTNDFVCILIVKSLNSFTSYLIVSLTM